MTSKSWTLVAAVLGSGITYLDSSVVTVALPRIGRELPHAHLGVLEGQTYVYNGYLLTLSALLILAGALTDYYGRRRMFAIGILGFGATSLLCGLAPTLELLVVFRVLQGAAGAFLVPGALSLITTTFTGEEQGRAFGIWSGAAAAITILGPFIGGVLVDTLTWRAAFLMNLPFVALAVWVVARHVRESRDPQAARGFDIPGTITAALAIGGLVFGAIYGQQRAWRDPMAFVALAVGVAAAVALVPLMTRRPHPLVPPELFRSRNFTVTNLSTFVIYGAFAVVFYCLPLFMQGTLGYTAAAVGLATLPVSVLLALFSARFGVLAARYGPRWFMAGGPALIALGVLWLARVPASSPMWRLRPADPGTYLPPWGYAVDFLPGLLVFGAGLMIMVAPLTTTLMTSVEARHAGLASAINNAVAELGPQLIGAIAFVVITAAFYSALAARAPGLEVGSPHVRQLLAPLNAPAPGAPAAAAAAARAASAFGFHLAMLLGAALLSLGALINAIGIRGGGTVSARPVRSVSRHWRRASHAVPQDSEP
ncbi:MAG TPA: MFS transporter [bacterium]|nr:MFS transporter [bacterium]